MLIIKIRKRPINMYKPDIPGCKSEDRETNTEN